MSVCVPAHFCCIYLCCAVCIFVCLYTVQKWGLRRTLIDLWRRAGHKERFKQRYDPSGQRDREREKWWVRRRRRWNPSNTLAWKIPWTEEPGRLQSMGLLRVRHDWATLLSLFTFMHWRRKWQPTPVLLPGESQGRESLAGCHLWGCTESDTTEAT